MTEVTLAFDCSTDVTSVAVLADQQEPGEVVEIRSAVVEFAAGNRKPRVRHAADLLELVVAALDASGHGWQSVARIGVGTGPGSYTGLRVAAATAEGIALSRSIPAFGYPTLATLALQVPGGSVLTAVPAGRTELFVAAYEGERCLHEPVAIDPAQLTERAELWQVKRVVAAGLSGEAATAVAAAGLSTEDGLWPSAIYGASIVRGDYGGEPKPIEPQYLRPPRAQRQDDARATG